VSLDAPNRASGTEPQTLLSGSPITIIPLQGLPEVAAGTNLGELVAQSHKLENGDVLVLAQKVVSKAEGRVIRLDELEPSQRARELAGADADARHVEAVLREAVRIVRTRGALVIVETRHGFVCASAGVDSSNAPEPGTLVLLPLDPDGSARAIRDSIRELAGKTVAVIVSDSFGRPWRQGTTDVAIGCAGLAPLLDLRGTRDRTGYALRSTQIAVADELAGAAELVMGKTAGVPGAIVRGFEAGGDGSASELVIPPERDLFR
jgi:coenzyme F420-0:L-glutamate ligase / coenzyme F420-1:gamma-L-glutamate ligase